MPEMPEVQAHAERMTVALKGSTLSKFELINFASLKTFDPPADGAVGATIDQVSRKGKHLALQFSNGHSHVIHLMQGGRIRPDEKRSRKPRFGLARWVFDSNDGTEKAWLFTEAGTERKAGIWILDCDLDQAELFAKLGPEATSLDLATLGKMLSENSRRVHGLLRQQSFVSGLGRMLTNEILYEARLSPFAMAAKLSSEQVAALHEAINSVVAKAVDHERTLDDIGKSVDRPSRVHNRGGEPCLDCDDTIRTVEYRKYKVFYCPTAQTEGKILADNTTSKFLK